MIVSINQPAYLPWLGYFHRIAASDLHVVLDTVQFEKNSFTNRNQVRTAQGITWLTVPVRTKGRFGDLVIRDVEIAEPRFAAKHIATLTGSYARAPFRDDALAGVLDVLRDPGDRLAPLCDRLAAVIMNALDISTELVHADDLDVTGAKSDLVLSICTRVGASTYLSGPFGRDYLDLDSFRAAGIAVAFHDYDHPVYPQCFPGFVPNLSAVDLLCNVGPEAGAVLRSRSEARS